MQGHLESQCRNKIRDERIKAQREEQSKKEKDKVSEKMYETENKDKDGFQTVNKRGSKPRTIPLNNQRNKEELQNKQTQNATKSKGKHVEQIQYRGGKKGNSAQVYV